MGYELPVFRKMPSGASYKHAHNGKLEVQCKVEILIEKTAGKAKMVNSSGLKESTAANRSW